MEILRSCTKPLIYKIIRHVICWPLTGIWWVVRYTFLLCNGRSNTVNHIQITVVFGIHPISSQYAYIYIYLYICVLWRKTPLTIHSLTDTLIILSYIYIYIWKNYQCIRWRMDSEEGFDFTLGQISELKKFWWKLVGIHMTVSIWVDRKYIWIRKIAWYSLISVKISTTRQFNKVILLIHWALRHCRIHISSIVYICFNSLRPNDAHMRQ